jgi:hypothetical protein
VRIWEARIEGPEPGAFQSAITDLQSQIPFNLQSQITNRQFFTPATVVNIMVIVIMQ